MNSTKIYKLNQCDKIYILRVSVLINSIKITCENSQAQNYTKEFSLENIKSFDKTFSDIETKMDVLLCFDVLLMKEKVKIKENSDFIEIIFFIKSEDRKINILLNKEGIIEKNIHSNIILNEKENKMMKNLQIFLLDNLGNTKNEISVIKPKTYEELLELLKQKFKNISEYYELFIIDKNNQEIKINTEGKFELIEGILFIREIEDKLLEISIFEKNYNELSESKQEILDEKFNCLLCSIIIKKENPYLCYKCQKIFHEKCLKDWDTKCKSQNKSLLCPNCRNELSIEKWNRKLNYEEERVEKGYILNKINELKNNKIKQNELIQKYEKYIYQTIEIFKNILVQLNSIYNLLKLEKNIKLNNLINQYPLNINNLDINKISNIIKENFNQFKIYIMNDYISINHINLNKVNNQQNNKMSLINNNMQNNSNIQNKQMMMKMNQHNNMQNHNNNIQNNNNMHDNINKNNTQKMEIALGNLKNNINNNMMNKNQNNQTKGINNNKDMIMMQMKMSMKNNNQNKMNTTNNKNMMNNNMNESNAIQNIGKTFPQ